MTGFSGEPDALDALWQHVLDHWDDPKAHVAFLEQAQQSDRLLEAATRYRGLTSESGRAQEAERRLKAIATLAMARLSSARTPPARAKRNAGALAFILVSLALAASVLLAYAWRP